MPNTKVPMGSVERKAFKRKWEKMRRAFETKSDPREEQDEIEEIFDPKFTSDVVGSRERKVMRGMRSNSPKWKNRSRKL